ncbi:MmcQ/YjbR family DNA-binding protein [Candidatus Saccharibacteria bacterium]|nr:MmcQ/YjbR family DNA-binding protein [Candidatus Saccharibacteria bacterium]
MVYDVSKVSGIGEFSKKSEKERELFFVNEKAFLVVNKNTVEVRCDEKLGKFLREKYESVMESRYFGRGGIEIVMSGQLQENEVDDLVRLSYNLSKD